jgi:DNA modification methylase
MEFLSLGHDLTLLRRRTAYFEEVNGEKSDHSFLSAVRGKGQIGHSNQYLTHWFYPYKGKYHGQMIKALINFMGVGQDGLILDPFVGSGTTLVECATLGIPSIGIDINPALCIVSQIKVDSLEINYRDYQKELAGIKPLDIFHYFSQKPEMGMKWFLGFNQLNQDAKLLLAQAWEQQFPDGFVKELRDTWRNLLFLCYLHALSDHTYLQSTNKAMPFEQFFLRDLNEYLDTLSGTCRVLVDRHAQICPPKVLFGTALELPLSSESVDGIVTSPPYSIALDYVRNDKHLLDYLGIDTSELREQMLGLKGRNEERIRLYRLDMKKSLQEMHRVLKPGCYAAILLGDVVVGSFRTNFAKEIAAWSKDLAFSETEFIRRPILGGYARLRYEYIILLRK